VLLAGSAAVAPVIGSILPTVLFVGLVLAGVVGVMSLVSRQGVYDEIERGGPTVEREGDEAGEQDGSSSAVAADSERELEIRQMLEARNARIVRGGGTPLDVEGEIARLAQSGAPDAAAAAPSESAQAAERSERELEIRQMLEARNARIVRGGGQPLDVEAEVMRLTDGSPGRGVLGPDDRV
jgi:hypothetical protein